MTIRVAIAWRPMEDYLLRASSRECKIDIFLIHQTVSIFLYDLLPEFTLIAATDWEVCKIEHFWIEDSNSESFSQAPLLLVANLQNIPQSTVTVFSVIESCLICCSIHVHVPCLITTTLPLSLSCSEKKSLLSRAFALVCSFCFQFGSKNVSFLVPLAFPPLLLPPFSHQNSCFVDSRSNAMVRFSGWPSLLLAFAWGFALVLPSWSISDESMYAPCFLRRFGNKAFFFFFWGGRWLSQLRSWESMQSPRWKLSRTRYTRILFRDYRAGIPVMKTLANGLAWDVLILREAWFPCKDFEGLPVNFFLHTVWFLNKKS